MVLSGGRVFFLVLLAGGQARGASVHYDACLDPGQAAELRGGSLSIPRC